MPEIGAQVVDQSSRRPMVDPPRGRPPQVLGPLLVLDPPRAGGRAARQGPQQVPGVARPQRRGTLAILRLVDDVSSDQRVQPVAVAVDGHQRVLDQLGELVAAELDQRSQVVPRQGACEGGRGVERPTGGGGQGVGRGLHEPGERPVPDRHVERSGRQIAARLHQGDQLVHRRRRRPLGRQLDRQRVTLQRRADPGDGGAVAVVVRRTRCSVEEERHRRRRVRHARRIVVGEATEVDDPTRGQQEAAPAGHDHLRRRAALDEPRQAALDVAQLLEVVEADEHASAPRPVVERLVDRSTCVGGQPQRGEDPLGEHLDGRRAHGVGVAVVGDEQRRRAFHAPAPGVLRHQPGLADARRADDRQRPPGGGQIGQGGQLRVAPDERCGRAGRRRGLAPHTGRVEATVIEAQGADEALGLLVGFDAELGGEPRREPGVGHERARPTGGRGEVAQVQAVGLLVPGVDGGERRECHRRLGPVGPVDRGAGRAEQGVDQLEPNPDAALGGPLVEQLGTRRREPRQEVVERAVGRSNASGREGGHVVLDAADQPHAVAVGVHPVADDGAQARQGDPEVVAGPLLGLGAPQQAGEGAAVELAADVGEVDDQRHRLRRDLAVDAPPVDPQLGRAQRPHGRPYRIPPRRPYCRSGSGCIGTWRTSRASGGPSSIDDRWRRRSR